MRQMKDIVVGMSLQILYINIDIKAINSNEYASRAKRPMNSKLSKDKLIEYGFKPLPHWEDALKDYLIRRRDLLI